MFAVARLDRVTAVFLNPFCYAKPNSGITTCNKKYHFGSL
jgi:hypothetical protein